MSFEEDEEDKGGSKTTAGENKKNTQRECVAADEERSIALVIELNRVGQSS